MGRIRTIKPEFPQSESIGRLSRDARLLFVQLWTIVDDSSRARANSRMLASLLYPYDDDAPGLIDGWLSELEAGGHIRRYAVDGSSYLDIPKFLEHQKIDRPSQSKLPPFDEGSSNPRRGLGDGSVSGPVSVSIDTPTADAAGSASKNGQYEWEGQIIRLKPKDFRQWSTSFPYVDLRAELASADAWLASDDATDAQRKKWFHVVAALLRKRNDAAKLKPKPPPKSRRPNLMDPAFDPHDYGYGGLPDA